VDSLAQSTESHRLCLVIAKDTARFAGFATVAGYPNGQVLAQARDDAVR
jgi:hypothetical protein